MQFLIGVSAEKKEVVQKCDLKCMCWDTTVPCLVRELTIDSPGVSRGEIDRVKRKRSSFSAQPLLSLLHNLVLDVQM